MYTLQQPTGNKCLAPGTAQSEPAVDVSSLQGGGESDREGGIPQVASIRDGPVAGDPLALPLVESMQLIGIVTHAPLFGIQIPPLVELVPQVIPVSIQNLCDMNGKSVRMAPALYQPLRL